MMLFKRNKEDDNEVPVWQGRVENKEKLTKEDAKFLFEQAEKILKDSVETSNTIVTRTNTLITLIAGSLIALMGYIGSKVIVNKIDNFTITASLLTVYLYMLIFYLFENTKPKTYLIPGSLPKDLLLIYFL